MDVYKTEERRGGFIPKDIYILLLLSVLEVKRDELSE